MIFKDFHTIIFRENPKKRVVVYEFNRDEKYQPEMRKYSKRNIAYYQPKSGTAIAYAYARQKRKILINITQLLE